MISEFLLAGILSLAAVGGLPDDDSVSSADTLEVAKVLAQGRVQGRSAAVAKVSSEKMEREGIMFVSEALERLPGVSVKNYGGVGGLKTVNVRNMGSTHTGVYYDGINVSDAQNGQPDLSRFLTDGLDEMTAWLGNVDDVFLPARALAHSSMLSLVSQKPVFRHERKSAMSARLSYGSFNTADASLIYDRILAQAGKKDYILRLRANYLYSKGNYPILVENGSASYHEKRDGSEVSALDVGAEAVCPVGDGEMKVKIGFYDSQRDLPGPVILYKQNPSESIHDRNYSASFQYETPIREKVKIAATLAYNGIGNNYVNRQSGTVFKDNYWQQEFALGARALFSVIDGFELSVADDVFGNTLETNVMTSSPRRISNVAALSAKYSYKGFTVTANGVDYYAAEQSGLHYHRFSPAINVCYGLLRDRSLSFRAGYKDSFRAPVFNDLYYARIGNRELKPEKASQFNFGAAWIGKYVRVSADGYYNILKDKIIASPSMFIWTMRNIDRCVMSGVDVSVSGNYQFGKTALYAGANYSFQYAVDLSNPEAKNYGHQIQYTPRHSGGAYFTVETPWVSATYTLQAVGIRYFLPQNIEANKMPAYYDHSVNIFHTFALPADISLKVGLQGMNLAGVNYEIIKGYPMPGCSFRLAVRLVL